MLFKIWCRDFSKRVVAKEGFQRITVFSLTLCYTEYGLCSSSIDITWELVRNADSQVLFSLTEPKSAFSIDCIFNKTWMIHMHIKVWETQHLTSSPWAPIWLLTGFVVSMHLSHYTEISDVKKVHWRTLLLFWTKISK